MVNTTQNEITSDEMTIQDINSEYLGIPRYLLMENAGTQIATFCKTLITKKNAKIAILCGTGGNGGDGFVAARHLHDKFQVTVYLTGSPMKIKSKPALKNYTALRLLQNIPIIPIQDSEDVKKIDFESYDAILDGVLGTGLHSNAIRQPLKALIEKINVYATSQKPVIAIDIPSGLKKDGTSATPIVKASHTVSLHAPKLGTYKYGGKVELVSIGIPPESTLHTGPGLFSLYPKRGNSSHKGQNGKILIIGGSNNYHGSPILAGKAAFALNIDLVYMIAPEKIVPVIQNHDYRFIIRSYPENYLTPRVVEDVVKPMLEMVDTVLLGPGIGIAKETMEAVKMVFKVMPDDKTLIIDADALKACKGERLPKDTILTPHRGEFAILTGKKVTEKATVQEKRQEIEQAIKSYQAGITWVAKGPVDIIVRNNKALFNYEGTPSMTTGGTGDILAGLITAVRSVVKDSFYAAGIGTFLIGKAGEMADEGVFSLQSLLDDIPKVIQEVENFIQEEENNLRKLT